MFTKIGVTTTCISMPFNTSIHFTSKVHAIFFFFKLNPINYLRASLEQHYSDNHL